MVGMHSMATIHDQHPLSVSSPFQVLVITCFLQFLLFLCFVFTVSCLKVDFHQKVEHLFMYLMFINTFLCFPSYITCYSQLLLLIAMTHFQKETETRISNIKILKTELQHVVSLSVCPDSGLWGGWGKSLVLRTVIEHFRARSLLCTMH